MKKLPKEVEKRFDEMFTSKLPEKGGGNRIFLTPSEKELVKSFLAQELSKRDELFLEEIKKIPTGLFDSTPYLEKFIKGLKNNLNK